MSTETQTNQQNNGKGFAPKQSQASTSKSETQQQPDGTSQQWEGKPVDVRMQGMQTIADKSIDQALGQFKSVQDGYYDKAQDAADYISQSLFDMASNRPLFEAVQHNLSVLMSTVEKVEKTSSPKPILKPRSLKLLQPESFSHLSKPALEAGKS